MEGSTKWGWGKINAYAAVQKALATTGWVENDTELNWTLYPNPTNHQLNVQNLTGEVSSIEIYDLNGKRCGVYTNRSTISVQHLAPGTYLFRIIRNDKVEQQKFVKK